MESCFGVSPGPSYRLGNLTGYENHDYSKTRAPAYSLGLKPQLHHGYATPGPYNVGNVDRNGKYPYQGWTIESKATTHGRATGPSPLSYAPEKFRQYTPAYSLGLKLTGRGIPFGPSPAEYYPQYPPNSGFTIGGPWKAQSKFVGPGPQAAVPPEKYKPRAPAYSLGLKGRSCNNASPSPGPKYLPGRICHHIPHAYSFGLRHGRCSPPLITYEDNN